MMPSYGSLRIWEALSLTELPTSKTMSTEGLADTPFSYSPYLKYFD
jgi:hypothetical protein